jgi:CheY-like chemotaxis protein
MQEHIERALSHGMSDYIIKPYAKPALLDKMGQFLSGSGIHARTSSSASPSVSASANAP